MDDGLPPVTETSRRRKKVELTDGYRGGHLVVVDFTRKEIKSGRGSEKDVDAEMADAILSSKQ